MCKRRGPPRRVVLAAECEENEDGDLICAGCGGIYADCDCLGPHNADEMGYDLEIENGELVAYRKTEDDDEEQGSQAAARHRSRTR